MSSDREPIDARFAFEAIIGKGAFAEVYRGFDRETGALVAIKRLHDHSTDAVAIDRLQLEARVLASVDHPNVVRYFGHGLDSTGRACLVLEWLDGCDLGKRQKTRALSLSDAVDAVRQAALGLGALHEIGVVHRDVKPENFFVIDLPEGGCLVKVLDLGIARATQEPTLSIEPGMLGTPAYMSPEQARGSDDVTPASDVFSLGVVLYQLLSGERPFAADDPHAILAQVILEEPIPLRDIVPEVPRELESIVSTALAKSPASRFGSMRAMAAALDDARSTLTNPHAASHATGPEESTEKHLSLGMVATAELRIVVALFAGFPSTRVAREGVSAFESLAQADGALTERTLGGRVIAVFGLTRSYGDEALRAARTALRAKSAIAGIQQAISTCRVRANAAGLPGDAIARGMRQLDRARGHVQLDAATARLVGHHFRIDGSDDEQVLAGELEVSHDGGPRLLGRVTSTVGREREIGEMGRVYTECVQQSVARALLVTGPAGVGKSRVRHEAVQAIEKTGVQLELLACRGDPMTAGSPFGMLAEAIGRAAGMLKGESLDVCREKLVTLIARDVPPEDVRRVAEFLGECVGTPFPDATSEQLRAARSDSIRLGDQMARAFIDWLSSMSATRLVFFVLEDLHWGDVPSVRFIDLALRALADRPLFVLGVARPEVHQIFPGMWRERALTEIALSELSAPACARLVVEVLGNRTPSDVVDRIVSCAAGNAYYLEELIRAVAEGRGDTLPDTVLAMVQSRFDALEETERRVLRAASVFGRTFWRGGVEAVLPDVVSRSLIAACIARLVAQELLVPRGESSFAGEETYGFRHALVRDAAYATLTVEGRRLGHRLAGEWLERAGETDAMALAEHFERGGEIVRASAWFRRAAEQALGANDLPAAVLRAGRGIELGASGELLGELRLLQAEASGWQGRTVDAEAFGFDAMQWLRAGSAGWYRAVGEVARATSARAGQAAIRRLIDAMNLAGPEGEPGPDQAIAWLRLAAQLRFAGEYEESEAVLTRVEESAGELALEDMGLAAVLNRARASRARRIGDPVSMLRWMERSLECWERAGDLREACIQRINVGYAYSELGAHVPALRMLRDAVATADRMGLQRAAAMAQHNLGIVLARVGKTDEALVLEGAAREFAARVADPRLESGASVYLAMIYGMDSRWREAEREARAAIAVQDVPTPMRMHGLAQLALALLGQGRVGDALEYAETARELLDTHALDEGEIAVRVAVAETLFANGMIEDAQLVAAAGRDMLLSRAARIDDEDLRQSVLECVPENARIVALADGWASEERTNPK